MKNINGFTLIELLVVITILLTLLTITVAGLSWFREKAKVEATRALILRIQTALSQYHEVFLAYPPNKGKWDGSQNLHHYLDKKLEYKTSFDPYTDEALEKSFGPAMGPEKFKKRELDKDKYVLDIWGNRLYYKNPGADHRPAGKNNKPSYDIESYGPNGKPDEDGSSENDDINNWQIEE